MNDILINIISAVVTTVLLPLITWAGTKLIQYIGTKVKNEKAATLLSTATTVVLNAVRSVFQTYVESLKASGSFGLDAQVEGYRSFSAWGGCERIHYYELRKS